MHTTPTAMLGKRKRSAPNVVTTSPEDSSSGSQENLQEIFKRHFEAQFQPLPDQQPLVELREPTKANLDLDEDDSDWNGISTDGEEIRIEVVEYTTPTKAEKAELSKEELKGFMTAKPPSAGSRPSSTAKRVQSDKGEPEEASLEAANLKNDLALQRLLKESHLLDATSSLGPAGTNRHKALDLRLQDLGSRSSILAQEKMPFSHRRGILSKATDKEVKRRHEAKENGIILEKVKKPRKEGNVKRERGIGAPGIGKFKGGTLKLSKKDIADIEGPKQSASTRRRA